MPALEIQKTIPTKRSLSNRQYAASIKAIMHSRQANTRRNIKHGPTEPWIGEIIVVKDYDQMDSLREILDLPARINGSVTEEDNRKSVECVDADKTIVDVAEQMSTTAENGVKRNLEEESVDESLSEQEVKRRRVMSPSSLCETPNKGE